MLQLLFFTSIKDACFDADRLDLGRVGITPDPKKMATERGKEMARKCKKW